MQVSITETELDQTAKLLAMLHEWERIEDIHKEYSQGTVKFFTMKNAGPVCTAVQTDANVLRNQNAKTLEEQCRREIGRLVGERIGQIAGVVCNLIREHMPIQVKGK